MLTGRLNTKANRVIRKQVEAIDRLKARTNNDGS